MDAAVDDRLHGVEAQRRRDRRAPNWRCICSISIPAVSEPIAHPEESLPGVRLNDGKVDPQGRFVVGSFDETLFGPEPSPVPRGSLYRLDTDLRLTTLERGVGVANGPCWSPDGRRFYFADTWAKTVWRYDWDAAGLPQNKRVFVKGSGSGAPDGATVDSEGYLWNAWVDTGAGGGDVRRYTPDGRLDRRIQLPTLKVTSVMFGGPNLDVLYVTSMGLSGFSEDRAADGGLFAIVGPRRARDSRTAIWRLSRSQGTQWKTCSVSLEKRPSSGAAAKAWEQHPRGVLRARAVTSRWSTMCPSEPSRSPGRYGVSGAGPSH